MTNCGANINSLNNIKVVYMNIEKKPLGYYGNL